MNIFVTHPDPIISAKNLDDKRAIKMILETAQMLSTAIHVNVDPLLAPYKVTHKNHPCSVWIRESNANYQWALDHMVALCGEYTIRFGKIHACERLIPIFKQNSTLMKSSDLTPFANCSRFKDIETILAYRLTMIAKWAEDEEKKRKARWTKTVPPSWYTP